MEKRKSGGGGKTRSRKRDWFKIKITHFLRVYSLVKQYLKQKEIFHPVKLIFIGKVISGKIKINKDEISDIKWFKPKEIFKMDKKILRDLDIKNEVKDYLIDKKYPLNIVKHLIYSMR